MTQHRSREERRAQILESAVTCFANKGYYETTMDDIGQETGLSKGALYWHFKGKRDLFRGLVEMWFGDMEVSIRELAMGSASSKDALRGMLESIKTSAGARPELVRAMLEFYTMALRDEELREWLRNAYVINAELFTALIAEGTRKGEFRDISPSSTARLLLAYVDGILLHQELFDLGEDSPNYDELTEAFMTLLEK